MMNNITRESVDCHLFSNTKIRIWERNFQKTLLSRTVNPLPSGQVSKKPKGGSSPH